MNRFVIVRIRKRRWADVLQAGACRPRGPLGWNRGELRGRRGDRTAVHANLGIRVSTLVQEGLQKHFYARVQAVALRVLGRGAQRWAGLWRGGGRRGWLGFWTRGRRLGDWWRCGPVYDGHEVGARGWRGLRQSSIIHFPLNRLVEGGLCVRVHWGHWGLIRRESVLEICTGWWRRRVRKSRRRRLRGLMLLKTGRLLCIATMCPSSCTMDVVPLRSSIVGILEFGFMPSRLVASRGFSTVRLECRSSLPAGVAGVLREWGARWARGVWCTLGLWRILP